MMKPSVDVTIKGLGMDITEKELDAKLEASDHQFKSMLQAMPEEPLSLAWRSSLNEKILVKQEQRLRKRRVAWFLSPALGLGVAGALAVMLLVKTPEVRHESNSNREFEAALVASHRENVGYSDVTGVGLNSYEVVDGKSETMPEPDISGVDLGSL